ncbi:MAG TPA: family 78 glycoside hydrolase catalytic domain [Chloroflexota bacterium]|nr:family 78 glycoside hydrolase catalytic domain [Chloroflexota bacterium]
MTQHRSMPSDELPAVTIDDVRFEHRREALGVGTAAPRLSWTVDTTIAGWRQAAYAVEAYGPDGRLRERTDRIESDQSVLVPWPFAPLASRQRLQVRVQVWGDDNRPSAWSAPYTVEAGLLHAGDWAARFVTPDWDEDTSRAQPCPMLRREFEVRAGVARARLYVTALGVYEAQLNGAVAGDHVLDPGWTSYSHRLRYQTFDVTELLRQGRNAIGAMLGDGWYRGRLSFGGGRRNIYGDRLALLAQLEIHYMDGSTDRIGTDETWRAATGPILEADLYDGETYDARLERSGWSTPGYDDHDWAGVRLLDRDFATLVAPSGSPVRRTELVAPVAITTSPAGSTIVDFGQNLVGRVRLAGAGPAGQTITLRHAEILQDGALCTRPLRRARATDRYIMRGGTETWEPRFTFHGFRYVEVEGWPGELRAEQLRAVVCHSDLERTGWFECSDPLVNRLHENVVWSMRGNFLDIPTDCPQRDERLGWTGDIQVFAPTACFLYDSAGFLTSWLGDLAAEQDAAGSVPFVVPNVVAGATPPAAAWGDAAVIVPWVLYQRYGDAGILATQFASMRAWVDLIAERAGKGRLWDQGFQFGDWLDPNAPPDRPAGGHTDPHLVATAYFARSAELLGLAAGIIGRSDDAERYLALAAQVREAFNREYVSPAGRLASDSATAYALALQFSLLQDADQRRHAGERLAMLVRDSGYRISTGFVGTPLVCDALCSVGAYDVAFRLLTQRGCPSWLYPVTMGATTIWERWDSLQPDGSVNPGEMTSFNHYAFGAIADWLHRTVGGLAPAAPGYRRLEIRPHPGGLTHARARHRTPNGLAECAWRIDAGRIEVVVVVPPNTTAGVTLPGRDAAPIDVGSGTHRWSYQFSSPARPPLSLDSTLVELVEDEDALNMAVQRVPELAGVEIGLQGRGAMPLRQVLSFLPHAEATLPGLEHALAALARERMAATDRAAPDEEPRRATQRI